VLNNHNVVIITQRLRHHASTSMVHTYLFAVWLAGDKCAAIKRRGFGEFSPCLSRACLGKMIVSMKKEGNRAFSYLK
jgi:hypothetical protein